MVYYEVTTGYLHQPGRAVHTKRRLAMGETGGKKDKEKAKKQKQQQNQKKQEQQKSKQPAKKPA